VLNFLSSDSGTVLNRRCRIRKVSCLLGNSVFLVCKTVIVIIAHTPWSYELRQEDFESEANLG
jgi:hypothetical protein